jgi:orotate phosphoribosyltransferase
MSNREKLRQLIDERCLIEGDFTLSSGEKSRFYFDCKRITLHGEGLHLIAQEVLHETEQLPEKPTAIGGLTMGADFIAAAVVVLSHQRGGSVQSGSIARKEPKKHGTRNKIENELPPGTKILVVDDVFTSAKSTLQACDEFEGAGYEVVGVLGIVDREAGGMETLRKRYRHVVSLFRKSDFPRLMSAMANEVARRATA